MKIVNLFSLLACAALLTACGKQKEDAAAAPAATEQAAPADDAVPAAEGEAA